MPLVNRIEPYRAWNTALAEEYFGPELAGRPAYLAVDDDELSALAPRAGVTPEQASDSLAKAVRTEARREGDFFRSLLRERYRWRNEAAEPPYIALLAVCVLAASRMATDPSKGVFSNDYYWHLNPLLGREPQAGRPPNFDELHLLWTDLVTWLDRDMAGKRGTSTVRTHDWFVHIGYPISQCLLRAADRRRLPDFFRSAGLEPEAEISPGRLLTLFRAWVTRGVPLTAHGQQVVTRSGTEAEEKHLAELLARELESWDGELRDERGRRKAEIVVVAESLAGGRRLDVRLFARRPEGFPLGEWRRRNGAPLQLREAAQGWYAALPVRVSSGFLREGFTIINDGFALALEGSQAVPLRAAFLPEAAWVSARQATPLEEHLVLAHASVEADLREFLRRYAEVGWRVSRPKGDLPPDWLVADRVRISAVPETAPTALRRLVPRLGMSMRFEGGLRLAPGVYLQGAEPDLWVTIEDEGGAEVSLDGSTSRLSSGIVELRLSEYVLEAGAHEIKAAGETRRFSSVWTLGNAIPDGAGDLGVVLEKQREYLPRSAAAEPAGGPVPRGHVVLCGPHVRGSSEDIPMAPHAPVVLRSGFRSYGVLGRVPGQLARPEAPKMPDWLRSASRSASFQFFEYSPPFPADLILYAGAEGFKLRPAHSHVAQPEGLASSGGLGPGEGDWARAILQAAEGGVEVPEELTRVWELYVAAGEAVLSKAQAA